MLGPSEQDGEQRVEEQLRTTLHCDDKEKVLHSTTSTSVVQVEVPPYYHTSTYWITVAQKYYYLKEHTPYAHWPISKYYILWLDYDYIIYADVFTVMMQMVEAEIMLVTSYTAAGRLLFSLQGNEIP